MKWINPFKKIPPPPKKVPAEAALWQYRPIQFFKTEQDWQSIRETGAELDAKLKFIGEQQYNGGPIYEIRPLYTNEQAYAMYGQGDCKKMLEETSQRVVQLSEAIMRVLKAVDNPSMLQRENYIEILREAINAPLLESQNENSNHRL
jgi:hypothetical protein